MTQRRLLCFLVFLLLLWPLHSEASIKYDLYFKKWGHYYFPFEQWQWWKAQGIAESNLNPDVVSWAGAIGIMQLMPATAKELGVNPYDPEANIQGGIRYDRWLWDRWKMADDRRRFMFASYNWGIGKTKRLDSNSWKDVINRLPAETRNYVDRIYRLFRRLN